MPRVGLSRVLSGALNRLHELPHDKLAWHEALQALTRVVPCDAATLFERWDDDTGPRMGMAVGSDAGLLGEYAQRYLRMDPLTSEAGVARASYEGAACTTEQVLGVTEFRRSGFYRRFLVRYGRLSHGVGGQIARGVLSSAHVWLWRPRGHPFDESERLRVEGFMAEARTAIGHRWRLEQAQSERNAALAWMDCATDATFVLDAEGRVLIANFVGESMLRDGMPLVRERSRLRPGRGGGKDWVAATLAAVIRETERTRRGATRCLSLAGRGGAKGLLAVMNGLPVPAGATFTGARAVLVLRDMQAPVPTYTVRQLREVFDFTNAEAVVAVALLAGETVQEIAHRQQVRPDTVSEHIKHMLGKTGVRRQGQLLMRLAAILPALRSFREG